MDQLEKFIQNNKESFDDQVPSKDLWSRIETETGLTRKFRIQPYISGIAATLLVVVGIGVAISVLNTNNNADESQTGLNTEVNEAALYYETQINQKKSEIYELTANHPDVREGLNQDLAMLDSAMTDIKNDLKDNVANEEVIEAMIQNYRLKLQILEDILSYVSDENTDTPKVETHEL